MNYWINCSRRPAATPITSSPLLTALSPNFVEVNVLKLPN